MNNSSYKICQQIVKNSIRHMNVNQGGVVSVVSVRMRLVLCLQVIFGHWQQRKIIIKCNNKKRLYHRIHAINIKNTSLMRDKNLIRMRK